MGHIVRDSPLAQFTVGEPAYVVIDSCVFKGGAKPPQRALADVTNMREARSRDLERVKYDGNRYSLHACSAIGDDIEKLPNTTGSTCLKTESTEGSDVHEIASYDWAVQRKSLRTTNRSIVSPKIHVQIGCRLHTFVITIIPKSLRKCQAPRSFQKSKGSVGIWLKCESGSDGPHLAFRFRLDEKASSTQVHDFAEKPACEISHVWDGLWEIPEKLEHDPEGTGQELGLAIPIRFEVTSEV